MNRPNPRVSVTAETIGPPSGSYSQGIRVGDLLFLSGQVASLPDGTVLRDSVTLQVRQALANLNEVATACGSSLNTTVQCRVYLRDLADFDEMDQEYRRHFADPMPARTTVQSNFSHFDVEIDAIIHAPQEDQ